MTVEDGFLFGIGWAMATWVVYVVLNTPRYFLYWSGRLYTYVEKRRQRDSGKA